MAAEALPDFRVLNWIVELVEEAGCEATSGIFRLLDR